MNNLNRKNKQHYHQAGVSLLMMLLALITLTSALSYHYFSEANEKLKRKNTETSLDALFEAKQNLLYFAGSEPALYKKIYTPNNQADGKNHPVAPHDYDINADIPGVGHLPCPDLNNDTSPDSTNCNTANINSIVGRLPQLQKAKYYYFSDQMNVKKGDAAGAESIWYAISGFSGMMPDFRLVNGSGKPRKEPLNSREVAKLADLSCGNGVVCLDGRPVVAVLVLAGPVLTHQSRATDDEKKAFTNYLESVDAADPWNFYSQPDMSLCAEADARQCFNDKVIAITINDWIEAMEKRVKSDDRIYQLCNYIPPSNLIGYRDLPSTVLREKERQEGVKDEKTNKVKQPLTPIELQFSIEEHWLSRNQWQDVICPEVAE